MKCILINKWKKKARETTQGSGHANHKKRNQAGPAAGPAAQRKKQETKDYLNQYNGIQPLHQAKLNSFIKQKLSETDRQQGPDPFGIYTHIKYDLLEQTTGRVDRTKGFAYLLKTLNFI